ncbi:DNA-binding protein [Salmonella enterica subsp. enterica serovar Dortmund]|nr:DNA-binding protein [Salmonella enterica subsp. enterica serovar Dortmund]ECB1958972.1 DNA-binding protein [Salmonella enterica subsp. enterica serovar Dortmund]
MAKSARSKVEIFRKDFITLARRAGGSYRTVAERTRIAQQFLQHLSDTGIKLRQVDSLKARYVESYIRQRLEEGIGKRTLQNEMSAIRAILSEAGKHKLADPHNERLNNRALGLSGACRDGTKIPMTPEQFQAVFSAVEKKDPGVAATMQLSYVLGLRNKEAIQSAKSLDTWKRTLDKGGNKINVVFGTKGGRPRETTIIDRERVLQAVNYALKYTQEHEGKLVDKPDMRSAMDRYRNVLRRAGMTGEYSPHSMRYSYAENSGQFHEANGLNDKEVLAMISMDLGHGDGRGRYIAQVYRQITDESE